MGYKIPNLNDDSLIQIFQYVDYDTFINLRLVSKRFKRIINSFKKKPTIKCKLISIWSWIENLKIVIYPLGSVRLQPVNLNNFKASKLNILDPQVVQILVNNITNEQMSKNSFDQILSNYKNLEKIIITNIIYNIEINFNKIDNDVLHILATRFSCPHSVMLYLIKEKNILARGCIQNVLLGTLPVSMLARNLLGSILKSCIAYSQYAPIELIKLILLETDINFGMEILDEFGIDKTGFQYVLENKLSFELVKLFVEYKADISFLDLYPKGRIKYKNKTKQEIIDTIVENGPLEFNPYKYASYLFCLF
uniref:F-box domain-containing protein n=1 Tax=viral metagenome TaxID=1070528 RepID=A0A6C0JSQ1_9ZZZZ